jgi:hypothetical protein
MRSSGGLGEWNTADGPAGVAGGGMRSRLIPLDPSSLFGQDLKGFIACVPLGQFT